MPLALAAALIAAALAQAEPAQPDWRAAESPALRAHTQLTFPDRFLKAGEAYFNPDATRIIFQAIERPEEGAEPEAHYAMFVADLVDCPKGGLAALDNITRLSPPGSSATCGYFHPTELDTVIFGCTIVPPGGANPAGYQRGTSTYSWQFPEEMEVCIADLSRPGSLRPLFSRPGYDAECAYSPDGRFIIYTNVNPETRDPDLWVFDTRTESHTPLVQQPGYDGGPFFSPDGRAICYRSDRAGNDLLQVFIATLAFDDSGAITGIERESQVTDNEHVNWAPFWHPSGDFLVYTTSEQGHRNYEVYAIEAPRGNRADTPPPMLSSRRITHAPGFDGLPVFSRDGRSMMWTSQRAGAEPGEDRPSSQLWIARTVDLKP